MTSNSPATARPSRLRRLTAALAVVAALVLATPLSAVAAASPAAADEQSPPTAFAMAPDAGGVVTAGQPVTVTLSAQNPGLSAVDAGGVRLSMSTTPLTTRAEVQSWLGSTDQPASRTESEVAVGALPAITGLGVGAVTLTIDAAALAGLAPGVYPLRADYDAEQGALTSTSVLVVPGDAGTGALAVVVPLTAPASTAGLLTADELAALTADDGDLRAQLDGVSGTSAVLAVDPAIVAAIRVLGSSAPASATAWLDDLMALPNPRFALQFADADLATQIGAGLASPLSVSTLDPYMSPADFRSNGTPTPTPTAGTATGTPTPTPSPTSTGGADAGTTLPTLAQLTAIGPDTVAAIDGVAFWPASGTAGSEVVTALGALSTDAAPTTTLVASSATTSDRPPAWARAGDARVLVYDADASTALGQAAASEAPVSRAAALAAASAYAAIATSAAPDAPLLVTVDRSTVHSAAALRFTLAAASTLSGRTATDLATLTAGEPASVALTSIAPSADRVDALSALLGDETDLASFSSILTDPTVLTAPERASILQLLSNAWLPQPDAAADAVTAHRAASTQTLSAVGVVPPSEITLAASSAPLTFTVRNDLPWPVSLVLIANPNDLRLTVQNTTPVTVGAAQSTRVSVPVQARVASGESTIDLQLHSPTGVPIGQTVVVHVAVRAEWESVGLVIMAVLVGGMLVGGIVRTIHRRRRARAAREDATDGR